MDLKIIIGNLHPEGILIDSECDKYNIRLYDFQNSFQSHENEFDLEEMGAKLKSIVSKEVTLPNCVLFLAPEQVNFNDYSKKQ